MTAIRTDGLTKRYGSTVALDVLDLAIEPGQASLVRRDVIGS